MSALRPCCISFVILSSVFCGCPPQALVSNSYLRRLHQQLAVKGIQLAHCHFLHSVRMLPARRAGDSCLFSSAVQPSESGAGVRWLPSLICPPPARPRYAVAAAGVFTDITQSNASFARWGNSHSNLLSQSAVPTRAVRHIVVAGIPDMPLARKADGQRPAGYHAAASSPPCPWDSIHSHCRRGNRGKHPSPQ